MAAAQVAGQMPEEVLEDLMIAEVANRGNQAAQEMPGQMPGLAAFDDDVEDFGPPPGEAVPEEDEDDDEDPEEDDEDAVEAAVSSCSSSVRPFF